MKIKFASEFEMPRSTTENVSKQSSTTEYTASSGDFELVVHQHSSRKYQELEKYDMNKKITMPHAWGVLLSVLFALSAFDNINAKPQQSLSQLVQDVFATDTQSTTTTTQRPSTTRRSGFSFVEPEAIDASQPQIKFESVSGRDACKCVRYHMCDERDNTITNNDDSFDGFGLIDLRFGSADETPICEHPLDKCCATNATRSVSLTPTPQEQRPNRARGCGIRNVGGIDFGLLGANDNEAGYGEFPWTVALLHSSNQSYFCAGSLIHPRVILTALHCVRDHSPSSFIARAGEWDTQTTRERLPYEERIVSRVLKHPNFNPRNVAYNFALVILKDPVTLGDHINTVCLPSVMQEPYDTETCYATGWGKDRFGVKGEFSVIMKRVPLPIVPFDDCQERFRDTRLGSKFVLDPSFVCAGGKRGVDTCQGDGGAPLVCSLAPASDNRYVQTGLVSWGIGCNDDIPAAYAAVGLARNWIDDQMLANGFATSSYTIP